MTLAKRVTAALVGSERANAMALWAQAEIFSELLPIARGDGDRPVFVHIPKAAGSSVQTLSVINVYGHKDWRFYERKLGRDALDRSFTIVRNPYDRLASAFYYLKDGGGNDMDARWSRKHLAGFETPSDFALMGLREPCVRHWYHFRPQAAFVYDRRRGICVRDVVRFERLEAEWPSVAAKYGLPMRLPHENPSKARVTSEFTPEARLAIFRTYRLDFVLFGYPE